MTHARLISTVGLLAAALATSVPAVAQATSARLVGTAGSKTLVVSAGAANNEIYIADDFDVYSIEDDAASINAGTGCTKNLGVVECPSAGVVAIEATLGEGNDLGDVDASVQTTILGENGDDEIGLDAPGEAQGGAGDDYLSGSGAGAKLLGDSGADELDGNPGDELDGGTGPDEMTGGTVSYAGRANSVAVSLDGNANDGDTSDAGLDGNGVAIRDNVLSVHRLVGSDFSDTLSGSAAAERIEGGGGADTISSGGGADHLTGGLGNDTLTGGGGAQTFESEPGNDRVEGGSGLDTFDMGWAPDGADVFTDSDSQAVADYARRHTNLKVTLGNNFQGDGAAGEGDSLPPGIELRAGSGADTLTGSSADEIFRGGPGNDTIDGGPGADVIQGDAGLDFASYANRIAPVYAHPTNDAAQRSGVGCPGATCEGDWIREDVEGLLGGSGSDVLHPRWGLVGHSIVSGGGGNDVLDAGIAKGIEGIPPLDTTSGLTLDVFIGGSGSDTVRYDTVSNRGEPITITLDGKANDGEAGEGDWIFGDVENATGGLGNDVIVGNSGRNVLKGSWGSDTIVDLAGGNDFIDGQDDADPLLYGGPGDDWVVDSGDSSKPAADALYGGPGSDLVSGGAGGDIVSGEGFDQSADGAPDWLLGDEGNDQLDARNHDSDNLLDCGTGTDILNVDLLPLDPTSVITGCEGIGRG